MCCGLCFKEQEQYSESSVTDTKNKEMSSSKDKGLTRELRKALADSKASSTNDGSTKGAGDDDKDDEDVLIVSIN